MQNRSMRIALTGAAALLASTSLGWAAEGDPSVAFLEGQTAPGESTRVFCGAAGFFVVQFIEDATGTVVSEVESGDTCDPNEDDGGGQDDADAGDDDAGDDDADAQDDDGNVVVDDADDGDQNADANANLNAIQKGNYADHLTGAFFSQPIGPLNGQPLIPSGENSPFIAALKKLCIDRVDRVQALIDAENAKLAPLDARISELEAIEDDADARVAEAREKLNELRLKGVEVDPSLVEAAENDINKFKISVLRAQLQILQNLRAVQDIREVADAAAKEVRDQIEKVDAAIAAGTSRAKTPAAEIAALKVRVALFAGGAAATFFVELGIDSIADREKKALVDDFIPIFERFQAALFQAEANIAEAEAEEADSELAGLRFQRAFIEDRLLGLQKDLEREKARCPDEFRSSGAGSKTFSRTSDAGDRVDALRLSSKSGPISLDFSDVAGTRSAGFAMQSLIAGRVWTFSLSGGASGLNDDRAGADLDSEMYAITAAASVELDNSTIGFGVGFTTGEVTSDDLQSELDGDYVSFGVSARHRLNEIFTLSGTLGYSRGSNDISIVGDTGSFNVDALSAGASISAAVPVEGWTISPSVSVGLSKFWREGYVDSAGDAVPSNSAFSGSVSGGAAVSRTFAAGDGSARVTPSLGLFGGYSFSDQDSAFATGGQSEDNGFGASVTGGVSFAAAGGATGSLTGSYGLFEEDVSQWSLGASVSIPLN